MVLQLTLAAEVGVDEAPDAGGPVREPPHHGGPAQSTDNKCTVHKTSFRADRPVDTVKPLDQPRHLGCLPRPVTALKHYQRSSLDG